MLDRKRLEFREAAWAAFSWEAFATLATGVLAVSGAVVIGVLQVGIQARQSAILERQVGLHELKLRSDLFERRFRVYEATPPISSYHRDCRPTRGSQA
jgi:hypothetical protein